MNETQVEALRVITLPEEDYFSLDAGRIGVLQGRLVEVLRPKGARLPPPGTARQPPPELLAISAPPTLDLARRTTFPLLMASVRSGQREWEVHAEQNRILLVANVSTGAVEVMAPLEAGRRMPVYPPSRSGPPPDAVNAAAGAALVQGYELFKWFKREAVQGRNAVTLIEYDRRSNTTLVNGVGEPGSKPERRPVPRVLAQAVAAPASTAGAPQVDFSVPGSMSRTGPAQLKASVRLPRTELTGAKAPAGSAHPLVMAATLLLLKLDDSQPQLLHLVVPAQPATLAGGVEGVEASFSVDLRAGLEGRKLTGTYIAYLAIGTTVTGPQPITMTGE